MSSIQQTAEVLAAAFQAGKVRAIETSVSPREIEELSLRSNQCHCNARKVATARGGKVVQGWIAVQKNLFLTHSIVELDGVLVEATPLSATYQWFIPRNDVPDAHWDEAAEWSTINLIPCDI